MLQINQHEADTDVIAVTCGAKCRRILEPIGNSAWVRVPRIVAISELGTFNRGTTETRASGRHSNRCYGGCQGRIQDTFALVRFANKASVQEPGLGVTARNFSALTVQGDSGPNGVSQSFAGTVEGEGPAVGCRRRAEKNVRVLFQTDVAPAGKRRSPAGGSLAQREPRQSC